MFWFSLIESVALATDDDHEQLVRVPVHAGIDAVTSLPEVEPGFAAHVLVADMLTDHFGLSASSRLTVEEDYYVEVYVGPAFRLGRRLILTPSVGLETAEMPLRLAGSAAWSDHTFEALAVVEYGGSGAWYLATANVWISWVGVGGYAQRFDGIGPWLGLRFEPIVFWAAPVYEPEEATAGVMAGVEFVRH